MMAATATAQTTADVEKRLVELEKAVKAAQSAGDNAWMLVSAALVLMMTGPGLALFYGGLVRRKNVLGTMMHSFILMAVVTVLWAVVGYSMAFGEWNPFVGGGQYVLLHNVGAAPNMDYAPTIPQQTFMIYQLMFAIITPALISGAFAERMKFSGMLLFMTLWTLLVYFPMAHMVWGKGRTAQCDAGRQDSHLRFCGRHGGAHYVRRFGAGVRVVLGQAQGLSNVDPMRPHSLVLSTIGACLLWVGWFGFNAGSALAASSLGIERVHRDALRDRSCGASLDVQWSGCITAKPSMLGGISGAVAGLGGDHARVGIRQAVAGDADRRRQRAWCATSW